MIKRLRRQFVCVNMVLVALVLLAVFAVFLTSTARGLKSQSLDAMEHALDWMGGGQPPRFEIGFRPPAVDKKPNEQRFAMVPVFSVELAEDGTVLTTRNGGNVSITDELLAQAVEQVRAQGGGQGVLPKLDLRYLMETGRDGVTRIAFAARGWEEETLAGLVGTLLLVGLGALTLFFGISLVLSWLALKPVKRMWEQQKQFVADASHELKTPITVILANTGIVLAHRQETVGQQAKWIEYTKAEAERMKGLVDDLLFLAKSDDAQKAPVMAQVALSDLVMGSLLPFESVAFEKGVELQSNIQPDLAMLGDGGQLRRLVLILLDNAVKYVGEKGTVRLTLQRQQDRINLTVQNTGEPIQPDHLAHLFERFYRVDQARDRADGGYGLGLAIAKRIVEAHRGKITVSSTQQDGTVFTVAFRA